MQALNIFNITPNTQFHLYSFSNFIALPKIPFTITNLLFLSNRPFRFQRNKHNLPLSLPVISVKIRSSYKPIKLIKTLHKPIFSLSYPT